MASETKTTKKTQTKGKPKAKAKRAATTSKRVAKDRRKKAAPEADRFREAWQGAVDALHTAQAEAERQLGQAMKENRFHTREIQKGVKTFRKRFEKERKRLSRELEQQIDSVERKVAAERKAASAAIDTGMRSALAALNIPSRKEIADLTHKVEALSRKIDNLRK